MSDIVSDPTTVVRKWYLLATGTGATQQDRTLFEAIITDDGGSILRLGGLVDEFMDGLVATNGKIPVFQEVAENGFGLTLTEAAAAELSENLDQQGYSTWQDIFRLCLALTGDLESTINGRVAAIAHFDASLDAANKTSYFVGNSASLALESLVQAIGPSLTDIAIAKAGLNDLVEALSASGIRTAVVDGYVSGATVVFDANGNRTASVKHLGRQRRAMSIHKPPLAQQRIPAPLRTMPLWQLIKPAEGARLLAQGEQPNGCSPHGKLGEFRRNRLNFQVSPGENCLRRAQCHISGERSRYPGATHSPTRSP
mgnify:CR=1 FL=1